jgi:hypothetical protein
MRAILENIKWFFKGLVVITYEDDAELWDNPRKRERIRRRWKKGEGR